MILAFALCLTGTLLSFLRERQVGALFIGAGLVVFILAVAGVDLVAGR